jgi:Type III restriction enzyme, res subunit
VAEKPVIPIYRRESFQIPIKFLKEGDVDAAHRRFTYHFYDQKKCKSCDNFEERHNDICDSCAAFKGAKQTSKVVTRKGKDYLSMPGGALKKVKKWLIGRGLDSRYELKDKRSEGAEFSRPIKFIKEPYTYQEEAVEVLLKKKRGILDSPPRTGKTVMGALAICTVGRKTLILASQREWLLNFQETFIGSETQEKFTNCKKRQIKICKTLKDFEETDICLSSFAKFMSPKGKKLLAKIKNLFGVVCVDECFTGEHVVFTDEGLKTLKEVYDSGTPTKILSLNHETGECEFRELKSRTRLLSKRLVRVTIEGHPFVCTENHEFWSETRKMYVAAKDLRPGEEVLSLDAKEVS